MFDFLDRLRAKPEKTRRRILHVSIGIIMVFVIGIWASTLPVRFSNDDTKTALKDDSPFSALTQTGAAFFSELKGTFSESKEGIQKSIYPALNATTSAVATASSATSTTLATSSQRGQAAIITATTTIGTTSVLERFRQSVFQSDTGTTSTGTRDVKN